MKHKALLIIGGLLLFCLGLQVGRYTTTRAQESKNASNELPSALTDDETEISTECNGTVLNYDSLNIVNYKGEPIPISALQSSKTLIARYSATACRPCLNALSTSLHNFADSNPDWKIILLISRIQLRDLYVMSREFGPSFELLACNTIPIDFDNGDTPVIFRIGEDNVVYDHFTCRYGDYKRTDNYLSSLVSQRD